MQYITLPHKERKPSILFLLMKTEFSLDRVGQISVWLFPPEIFFFQNWILWRVYLLTFTSRRICKFIFDASLVFFQTKADDDLEGDKETESVQWHCLPVSSTHPPAFIRAVRTLSWNSAFILLQSCYFRIAWLFNSVLTFILGATLNCWHALFSNWKWACCLLK